MSKKNSIPKLFIRLLEGIIVGFGAIMPGISGGTLCVSFGMYKPIIDVLSHPKKNIPKYWKTLIVFFLGGAIGFIGLSGLADFLWNKSSVFFTCAFIGFIIGTFPELWRDAGKKGRGIFSYIAVPLGFIIMVYLLSFFKTQNAISLSPSFLGFLICGIFWGLSFIVPGLSSSTLIIFLGLYQPMLEGISHLSPSVIIPLGLGILMSIAFFSQIMGALLKKFFPFISHTIIGLMAATTVMIFPPLYEDNVIPALLWIGIGIISSYLLTSTCIKPKK